MTSNNRIHTLFKLPWNTHQDRSHTGVQTHITKFKRTEIMQSMLPDHNGIKQEISNKNNWKSPKYLEIKQQTSEKHMSQSVKRNSKTF